MCAWYERSGFIMKVLSSQIATAQLHKEYVHTGNNYKAYVTATGKCSAQPPSPQLQLLPVHICNAMVRVLLHVKAAHACRIYQGTAVASGNKL
jgi:hypothetical protein